MPHTPTNNIIDHIFAHSVPLKKQKKPKINRSQPQPIEAKRPTPEIVYDPSSQQSHSSTSGRISQERPTSSRSSKKRKLVEKLDQDNFNDSRGTGPRRKTEEGFSIYKEDELGINVEAGGTSLCPFDCNCCF